jgi:acyl-CoA synthetase (AMP-forming)/AMP-acid ligase II
VQGVNERERKLRSRVCEDLSILVTRRRAAGRQPLGPVGKSFSRPAGVQLSHGDRVLGCPAHAELGDLVVSKLGSAFRPEAVVFADDLPRTRSAKLVRRAIRAATRRDPGDLIGLENPDAVEKTRNAMTKRATPL